MATRRRTAWVLTGLLAAAVAAVLVIIAVMNPQLGSSPLDAAKRAAQSFVDDAVEAGPWTAPEAAARSHAELQAQLRPAGLQTPVSVTVIDLEDIDAARKRATLSWAWQTNPRSRTQVPDWSYTSQLDVVKADLSWKAEYQPAVVHPQLHTDAAVEVTVEAPERAKILGAGDEVLTSVEPVVSIGIEPARTDDPRTTAADTAAALSELAEVDAEALTGRIEKAGAHAFVPVITIRADDYRRLAEDLRPIPGTVFRTLDMSIPVHQGLAPLLLGRVDEATAEDLDEDPLLREGDLVGQSGLQKLYQAELSGRTGVNLQIDEETVLTVDAVPAPPVKTTIDRELQRSADAAAQETGAATGIVVIDAKSGQVRAVANAGGDAGFDRALSGHYPDSPAHALATALQDSRGSDAEVLAALGLERIDLGMPASASAEGQPTGSPLSVAVSAARALTGERPPVRLVTSVAGEDLDPQADDAALSGDEQQELSALLDPFLIDIDSTPSTSAVSGAAATAPIWSITAHDGLIAAAVVEAPEAGASGADTSNAESSDSDAAHADAEAVLRLLFDAS